MTSLPLDVARCVSSECPEREACARWMDRPLNAIHPIAHLLPEAQDGQCRYRIQWEPDPCPFCGRERIVATSPTTGCCDGERSRAWRDQGRIASDLRWCARFGKVTLEQMALGRWMAALTVGTRILSTDLFPTPEAAVQALRELALEAL